MTPVVRSFGRSYSARRRSGRPSKYSSLRCRARHAKQAKHGPLRHGGAGHVRFSSIGRLLKRHAATDVGGIRNAHQRVRRLPCPTQHPLSGIIVVYCHELGNSAIGVLDSVSHHVSSMPTTQRVKLHPHPLGEVDYESVCKRSALSSACGSEQPNWNATLLTSPPQRRAYAR